MLTATMRRRIAIAFAAGGLAIVSAQPAATDFDAFVQRYSDAWMRFHPDAASSPVDVLLQHAERDTRGKG